MSICKIFFVAGLFLFVSGCASRQKTMPQVFLPPDVKTLAGGQQLSVASPEVFRLLSDQSYSRAAAAVRVMNELIQEGATIDEAYERASLGVQRAWEFDRTIIGAIQKDFDYKTDTLLYYVRKTRRGIEEGWVVYRNGAVKTIFPLATRTK